MNKCNKSAIILPKLQDIKLHEIQKQLNKPSFLGKDKIYEFFWGYQFQRHFPNHLIFRGPNLFEAGVFEWWKKHLEFSFILKLRTHGKSSVLKNSQNDTSSTSGDKTAVAVLSIIPGVGLLSSIICFILWENLSNGTQRRKLKDIWMN